MRYIHFLACAIITLGFTGYLSSGEGAAANEMKSTKSEGQMKDKTTTKSKLQNQKNEEAEAFKELNKHAPGGADAAPDIKGSNKSGGGGTGTGSGTGTTGASGGSGSGGSGGSGGGGS